ncbi:MAG: helix-turn-helix domain-containing protein [Gaiellaceae bacterium]
MTTEAQERPALLSQRQAGEILGLSRMSMQRLIAAGSLKPVRIAGLKRPRYRTADIETLIREGRAP